MRAARLFLFIFLSLFTGYHARANDSASYSLKINFLYGSKPAKGHKASEQKLFGGLKGGHVNIESGGRVLDFMPGNNPVFPKNKKPSGGFTLNSAVYWNTKTDKWKSIEVPLNEQQYNRLQQLFDTLSSHTPYDYALFGMRCAAASYFVLSQVGLFREMKAASNVGRHFYPKLLRKKILKWARKNHLTVLEHEGRGSRKWETDKGVF